MPAAGAPEVADSEPARRGSVSLGASPPGLGLTRSQPAGARSHSEPARGARSRSEPARRGSVSLGAGPRGPRAHSDSDRGARGRQGSWVRRGDVARRDSSSVVVTSGITPIRVPGCVRSPPYGGRRIGLFTDFARSAGRYLPVCGREVGEEASTPATDNGCIGYIPAAGASHWSAHAVRGGTSAP
jgi:hypothetical protein